MGSIGSDLNTVAIQLSEVGTNSSTEGDGGQRSVVLSGSIVTLCTLQLGRNNDGGLQRVSSSSGDDQILQDSLRTVVVDSVGLLVQDEAVVDQTTLAIVLLPYRLFILYFSQFPMRSAYIFTLVFSDGRGRVLLGTLYSAFAGSVPTRYGEPDLLQSALPRYSHAFV